MMKLSLDSDQMLSDDLSSERRLPRSNTCRFVIKDEVVSFIPNNPDKLA
jgi:hypothetical protein